MPLFLDNRELLDRFRKGDPTALDETYRFYAPRLARFLSRGFQFNSQGAPCYFRGFHQAFDLDNAIQETFSRAFRERARLAYDGIKPYRNYLYTIARNLVIDEFRRREVVMSQFVVKLDGSGDGPASGYDVDRFDMNDTDLPAMGQMPQSPEENVIEQEVKTVVRDFLVELDDDERALMLNRFHDGLSQEAAGEKLGLTRMQIRTRETKLRKKLLAFLKQRGFIERGALAGGLPAPMVLSLAASAIRLSL